DEYVGKPVAIRTGLTSVNNGGMRIMVEVYGCMRCIGIGQQPGRTVGGRFQRRVQLVDADIAPKGCNKINGRNVQCRHSNRLGLYLSLKIRQKPLYALSQAGGDRNDG